MIGGILSKIKSEEVVESNGDADDLYFHNDCLPRLILNGTFTCHQRANTFTALTIFIFFIIPLSSAVQALVQFSPAGLVQPI